MWLTTRFISFLTRHGQEALFQIGYMESTITLYPIQISWSSTFSLFLQAEQAT